MTPHSSLSTPFTIGVTPLDLKTWLDPDQFLLRDLAEKAAHLRDRYEIVFRQTPETGAAQAEVRDMIAAHLVAHFPQLYRRDGKVMHLKDGGSVDLTAFTPLEAAARLVQEDLCLMRKTTNGWQLAAACLCFPSSWALAEKIGRGMAEIHLPVPGFAGRMHELVGRMFDNMQLEKPMLRYNWSLYGDGALHHPETHADPERFPAAQPVLDVAHLRIERQTLRKLPLSGDILFTIRIYSNPLQSLFERENGLALAGEIREHLQALNPEQAAYKGIVHVRQRFIAALDSLLA